MTQNSGEHLAAPTSRHEALLSKVPQVTVFFWLIKVLCTTVGETASDFLNINLGFGLVGTSIAAGIALAVVLFFQFQSEKYLPAIYWLSVVLISVFGTLVTDILTDTLHFPLEASTVLFSIALALTFALWYAQERTLSIHSIVSTRREAFYWLAILFTFALGTASGDLMAESLGLGYLVTGLIVLGVIVAVAIAWRSGLDAVLGFWIAYILTRPLGASLGDYLSQARANGGLGFGATLTSAGFLAAILVVVTFLATTRRDFISEPAKELEHAAKSRHVVWQVVATAAVMLTVSMTGYFVRTAQLRQQAAASTSPEAPLGDLTAYKKTAAELQSAADHGDLSSAKSHADSLETAWDSAQALLRPMNQAKWTSMDDAIDDVLAKVRAPNPNTKAISASVKAFVHVMDTLGDRQPRAKAEAPASEAPKSASATKPPK